MEGSVVVRRSRGILRVICPKNHRMATVDRDRDGAWCLDIERSFARRWNRWRGTPMRVPVAAGSTNRMACACGRWDLVSHEDLIEAAERGDTVFIVGAVPP